MTYLWIALAALAVIALIVIVLRARGSDHDDNPKLVSLVFLLKRHRPITEVDLLQRFSQALGVRFGNTPNDSYIVKELRPGMIAVQYGGDRFGVMSIDKRYTEQKSDELDPQDARVQRALDQHTAWIAIDLMDENPDDSVRRRAYRTIGKLLASLYEPDNCLALFAPELDKLMYCHPQTPELLTGEDPTEALEFVESPIVSISADDPRMLAAVERARREWPRFLEAFSRRTPEQNFGVKAPFVDGDEVEYMWVEVDEIADDHVTGRLGNSPAQVKNVKEGQVVRVDLKDLNDWMYDQDDDSLVGGFTIDVLRDAM